MKSELPTAATVPYYGGKRSKAKRLLSDGKCGEMRRGKREREKERERRRGRDKTGMEGGGEAPEGEEMEASAGNLGKKSVCFCADDFMFHMCHIILELLACFSSKKKIPQEKHHGQACS